MKKLKTTIKFAKNYASVGAFKESSVGVEREICTKLHGDHPTTVVEFGTGLGNITTSILRHLHPDSRLYSFEINKQFCDTVRAKIEDHRLVIINDSAEQVKKYINRPVDAIVGSLPFSFIPKEVGLQIIKNAYDVLRQGSFYSQYLYVGWMSRRFMKVFDDKSRRVIKGIPNEYVYHFEKAADHAERRSNLFSYRVDYTR